MNRARVPVLALALLFAGAAGAQAAPKTARKKSAKQSAARTITKNRRVARGPVWVNGAPFFFFPGIGFVPASDPGNPFDASVFGLKTDGWSPSGLGPFSPPTVVAPGRPGQPQIAFDSRANVDPNIVSGTFGFDPRFNARFDPRFDPRFNPQARAGNFFNPGLAGSSTGWDPRFIFRGDIRTDPRRFGVDPGAAASGSR